MVALIMAGGKGTRMKLDEEKPLIEIRGKSFLERIVETLRAATKVHRIVIAVTKDTPKTARMGMKLGAEVLETPGLGYVEDMRYAIKSLRLGSTIVVSADLPLLKSELIDMAIGRFEKCSRPSLSLVVSLEKLSKLGLEPDFMFSLQGNLVTPVGVNIIDGNRIDEPTLDQENLIVEEVECLVNVNTPSDLLLAEKLVGGQERKFSRSRNKIWTVNTKSDAFYASIVNPGRK